MNFILVGPSIINAEQVRTVIPGQQDKTEFKDSVTHFSWRWPFWIEDRPLSIRYYRTYNFEIQTISGKVFVAEFDTLELRDAAMKEVIEQLKAIT